MEELDNKKRIRLSKERKRIEDKRTKKLSAKDY